MTIRSNAFPDLVAISVGKAAAVKDSILRPQIPNQISKEIGMNMVFGNILGVTLFGSHVPSRYREGLLHVPPKFCANPKAKPRIVLGNFAPCPANKPFFFSDRTQHIP